MVTGQRVLVDTEINIDHKYLAINITSSRTTTGNKTITYTAGEVDLLQPFQVDSARSVNGQIQNFTPVNLVTNYVIRDHLGNNRVFFWDSTGNNSLSTDEIRADRSYYPFGMDMRQANSINPEFKYGFGDKEELEFVGYGAFGARCLDGTTCRWTSTDPGINDPSNIAWSPFTAMWNNPLNVIDPSGAFNEYIYDTEDDSYTQVSDLGGNEFDIISVGKVNDDGSITVDPNSTISVDVEITADVNYTGEVPVRIPGAIVYGANPGIQTVASPIDAAVFGIPNLVRSTGAFFGRQFISAPSEAYNRRSHYGNAPKKSDRTALGAQKGEVVDHEPSLVQRFYEGDPKTGEKPGYKMTQQERASSQ